MIWRYHDLREDVLKALELVSPEQARPYVLETIEIFGSDRAMVASNFPTDKLFGSFDRHLGAYDAITADFSADERHALLAGNANRIYRLGLDLSEDARRRSSRRP